VSFLPPHVDAGYVRRACAGGRCKPPPLTTCTKYDVRRLPGGRIAFRPKAVGEFYARPTRARVPTSWLWEHPAWRGPLYGLGAATPPGLHCGVPAWRSFGLAGLGALGATELPDRLTPLTPEQATHALATAYRRVTGKAPTSKILGLLVAQTAQETAEWQSLHNFGFGNLKASASDPYYQGFRCWEIVNGQKTWYESDNPMCRFAAYLTAADGAERYIRLLMSRPHWWNGLHTETVDGFVAGLTTAPVFFTGDPAAYARRMTGFVSEYGALAMKYAGQHRMAVVGTAVGVFALTFGGWYLYNTLTSKKRAA